MSFLFSLGLEKPKPEPRPVATFETSDEYQRVTKALNIGANPDLSLIRSVYVLSAHFRVLHVLYRKRSGRQAPNIEDLQSIWQHRNASRWVATCAEMFGNDATGLTLGPILTETIKNLKYHKEKVEGPIHEIVTCCAPAWYVLILGIMLTMSDSTGEDNDQSRNEIFGVASKLFIMQTHGEWTSEATVHQIYFVRRTHSEPDFNVMLTQEVVDVMLQVFGKDGKK